MPIYDWRCEACGVEVEVQNCDYDQEPPTCECGSKMIKIITKPPFVRFLGEGWYATEHGTQRHNCVGEIPSSVDEDFASDDGGE